MLHFNAIRRERFIGKFIITMIHKEKRSVLLEVYFTGNPFLSGAKDQAKAYEEAMTGKLDDMKFTLWASILLWKGTEKK